MSKKNSHTAADYIDWEQLSRISENLEKQEEYKFSLLISIASRTSLRIGDVLSLRWKDIINRDCFELTEQKTEKFRKITLNEYLQRKIDRIYKKLQMSNLRSIKVRSPEEFVFKNKYGIKPISVQYVNFRLKEICKRHRVRAENISSHSLRKSFGRRVWEMDNYSDRSLILLSEILNHANVRVTKRYLGIRKEEIADVFLTLD